MGEEEAKEGQRFQCGWCGNDICCEPISPPRHEVAVYECETCGKRVEVRTENGKVMVRCVPDGENGAPE